MADKTYWRWVWKFKNLNRWIAILFMVGSALFALGCVLYLANFHNEIILDSTFFIGSIFFTTAAYCQFHQSLNAGRTSFYSALIQLAGTLMFNVNTFDAFFDLNWFQQDLLVWSPNILGSIFFQISGSLTMLDICKRWWCWKLHDIDWWIGIINFVGCVTFLISASLSFALPHLVLQEFAIWSTGFTLLGACCFFIGALLMLPRATSVLER